MAGGFSKYTVNSVGALVFGATSFTRPTAFYAQPNELQPAEDGTGADVPDNGYSSRTAITFGSPSSGSVNMSSAVTLYTATGAEDLDSVAIYDASTSGNLLALAVPSAILTTINTRDVRITSLTLGLDSGPMQTVLKNAILSHLFGGSAYTPESAFKIGLISSGTTELSGSGYARASVSNNTSTWASWANERTSNLINIDFGPASATWTTATRFGIWDNSGTNLLWVDDLPAPLTVTSGNYGRIGIGDLVISMPSSFGSSLAEPIVGQWYEVTAAGMNMADTVSGNDSYGIQDIVFDPARPSDAYAFLCFQGVWKSTDFGKNWSKVSTTTVLDSGKLWSACIDTNASRNPLTPPTMWTLNGTGSTQGVFKSTDGGVTWVNKPTGGPSEDVYTIVCDPYDSTHLLVTFHGDPQVYESFNGGDTWAIGGVSPANGNSGYVFFVDTGNATTTADTWIHIPQDGEGVGVRRTTNGGSSWTTVISGAHHAHGLAQVAQFGGGTIVLASAGQGIYESTNYGSSWTLVDSSELGLTAAACDSTYVYVWNAFPAHFTIDHRLRRRLKSGGSYSVVSGVDAGLTNGGKNMAISLKNGKDVLLMGAWQAGIWRWVKP